MTIQQAVEAEALNIIKQEKTDWEMAPAFVTEKVYFNMREVIRTCRKNYWGVFDTPIDPVSGREKIWQHLTKAFVDFKVKNQDLDTKDINFRAKHPNAVQETAIIRSICKNKLDSIFFGEILDIAQRQLEIDGTVVWEFEDGFKPVLVDLLNCYIDPVSESIAEADAFMVRTVLPLSEFRKLASQNGWINVGDVEGTQIVNKNDPLQSGTNKTTTKYVELYKRRGMAPKFLITGKQKDKDVYVPTEIIASGTGGNWQIHNIETRKDNKKKGYEEAWANRVHGRWYGEGTAERLVQYQQLENENLNIRRERGMIAKLGIFQIRKGAGITPQSLSRLTVNGAVEVNNPGQDLVQMPVQDIPVSAYKDEEIIYSWAQRITGAFDVAVGESLPASTPATNAALQAQGAKAQSTLNQEGFGMFLQRCLKNYMVPAMLKETTIGDIVRMEFDPKDLRAYDERIVNNLLYDELQARNDQQAQGDVLGASVDPMQVMMEQQRAVESLQRTGQDRFIKLEKIPDILEYDVEIFVTNEEIDKGVAIQNIVSMLPLAPEYRDQMLQSAFDLMGITLQRPQQMAPQLQQGMAQDPNQGAMQAPTQNPTQVVTSANTMQ